ncbi:transcriptional regulator domain-containing protein [Pelagibacterium sp.]|uniref:transcriptional regulator domain-containing protein n=1 Tax=Pelagibacterium sp. TaxID=1967288 RepID=UPI003BACA5D8
MVELGNGTAWPDWWDDRSYDYTACLTRLGWAWEFLRRNPAFQHDLRRALEQVNQADTRESLDVVVSPVDLSRWGVLFR